MRPLRILSVLSTMSTKFYIGMYGVPILFLVDMVDEVDFRTNLPYSSTCIYPSLCYTQWWTNIHKEE